MVRSGNRLTGGRRGHVEFQLARKQVVDGVGDPEVAWIRSVKGMDDFGPVETLRRLLPQCLLPDQVRLGSRLAHVLEEARRGRKLSTQWDRWIARAQKSIAARGRRKEVARQLHYPAELPIAAQAGTIVTALRNEPVLVIAGETGSGKTTQLPKMCLEAGFGLRARIGCTQPRRVAALSIARRLAEELGVVYGREVGSKIRFNDRVEDETAVKIMTDGILLMEVQRDPLLSEYEVVMIDEAHERSLNVDFLLGHLRNLLKRRDDLKVIVTSATIDTGRFAEAFGQARVIEVSGRLYPVEVRYRPPAVADEDEEHEGETYVEAAVAATAEVAAESASGDVLVFMPGERDIREASEGLKRALGVGWEVLPLFGRLSGAEQDAIFRPGPQRRVVVATNIAETSLTVPRIRYVIDGGLARVSRYHAGTRCRRLPIEPIARSNADQRKGRCGRLSDGICVRLYEESDYESRPAFFDPEILRCNLADVVLRLKAFRLGEAESFPFIDPPPPGAIRGAYALLQELGALDDERGLTPLGRELARLPVDPSIGRMLLEARHEGALPEVLVIAAGLSIQDPRERPLERREEAERAHRRFAHPDSDFLGLLNLWKAYHETWETLRTQSQLRKFCREHFLSFLRMREWVDVHGQLSEAMFELGERTDAAMGADYAAIHRSLVAGLLGHVGQRRDTNLYGLAGQRQVALFPGSGLFVRPDRKRRKPGVREPVPGKVTAQPKQPGWMVAGEIVETTRPYARTVARIEPGWVVEVAPHVVRRTVVNPRWDPRGGRVLATEQISLRGLMLQERRIGYLDYDPQGATEIFVREGLVPRELPGHYLFLESNDRLIHKIEFWQTGLRQRILPDVREALVQFYMARLHSVGSVHDLNRLLKDPLMSQKLRAKPEDLLGEQARLFSEGAMPDRLPLGEDAVSVRYAYAPGEDHDGVTFRFGAEVAEVVDSEMLEWAVPLLREQRLLNLLRALPKSLRRALLPLDATVRCIIQQVDPGSSGYLERVSRFLLERYGVEIGPDDWSAAALPMHLRPRFEVVQGSHHPMVSGRSLSTLVDQLRGRAQDSGSSLWAAAVDRWERSDLKDWNFGDLPAELKVGEWGGFPVRAYPGLQVQEGAVHLRLFRKASEAAGATGAGVACLAERVMHRELVWVQKDLRDLRRHQLLYATLGSLDELLDSAWDHLRGHLFPMVRWEGLQAALFAGYLERARGLLPGLVPELSRRLEHVLATRQETLMTRWPLPAMRERVDELVPRRFLSLTPWDRVPHLPRYLKALALRAERAALNPVKDRDKQARVAPYEQALREITNRPQADPERVGSYRWLLEEYRVSVFAQELGTALKISARVLDQALEALRAPARDAPTS